MNRICAPIILGLLLSAGAVHAQAPAAGVVPVPIDTRPTTDSAVVVNTLPKGNAEYRLGPGDLIEVSVFGVDDFHHTLRISASGVLKFPLIEPVNASGVTPAELEQRLALLLGADVIKDPQVSVFVKEYRSQPVYVLGAVRTPGQYQITMQLRIVDAIAMAGGVLPTAGDGVVIQRPLPGGGEQTIPVDLSKLVESGDLSQNVLIQGGDVVHVRERVTETVYVVGEVNRAGAFQKAPKQEFRVTQVLAWAGGPMKTAKLGSGVLLRYTGAGVREEVPLNFSDIFSGKAQDVFVRANDVIFLPGSNIKTLGYGMLNALPGTLATIPFWIP